MALQLAKFEAPHYTCALATATCIYIFVFMGGSFLTLL